jgi:prepilin-type processing-associated H-X9-DG protein
MLWQLSMRESSKLRWKFIGLIGLFLVSGLYSVCLYSRLTSTNRTIALLQMQLSGAGDAKVDSESLQRRLRQFEQLEDLRKDNAERKRLRFEVDRLRAAVEKQKHDSLRNFGLKVSQLQTENLQLHQNDEQLEQSPETIAARQAVDMNELLQIGQALASYAKMNDNEMPQKLTELRPYTSAEVFPMFETNRFEVVYRGKLTEIADPTQTPLVRSRLKGVQNERPCLFADGHVQIEKE